ncbi:S41 family peptidase [Terriglobus sp. ADX1]|uniref:S41 family peptidase n=1 Tax=Terriglobus sp. ADX1 TaxID=2794063 RepID=UPI002FE5C73B
MQSLPWRTLLQCAFVICFSVSVSTFLHADGQTAGTPPLWMRYPAISPDAKTIAFIYHGHLFSVPSDGGQATALTAGDSHETAPVWSQDGKLIAFASDRFGHYDVFIIPANGGTAKRLTTYSVDQIPTAFTSDGKFVMFSAHRTDLSQSAKYPSRIFPELYKVSINEGRAPIQLLSTPALGAHYDHEGIRMLYEDVKGYEDPWRKHETYANAHKIVLYDSRGSSFKQLTSYIGENRNPQWAPDEKSFDYLSEQSGSFNVWQMSLTHGGDVGVPKQLTHFEKNPVRFLTVAANGTLCFGFDGEIYTLGADASAPQKVNVRIALSETRPNQEILHFKDSATEMTLSPNGKEVAFVVRGDVYAASVETGDTKRITNTPGQERNVSFSPDGRHLVFAAEYERPWALYEASIVQPKESEPYFFSATSIDIKPLLRNDQENFQPKYSPDGQEVAYLENRTTLKVINLGSRTSRTILPGEFNFSAEDGDQWFEWSPDSRWFLVTFLDRTRWSKKAGLIAADGQHPITNVTVSGYEAMHPQWNTDGSGMTWISDKYGLHGSGYDSDFNGDILETFFSQTAADRFRLSKSEYAVAKELDKDRPKTKPDTGEPKGKPLPTVSFDLNNLHDREVRLTLGSTNVLAGHLAKDGESLLYLAKGEKGADLWLLKIRNKELKRLASIEAPETDAAPVLQVSEDDANAYVLAAGKITRVEVAAGTSHPVAFDAEKEVNGSAERAYLFDHIWRLEKEKFFDPGMNGVDWDYYKKVYARFLPHIDNDEDLAEMCSEMLGELNSSHTGCRYRRKPIDDTAALGAFYDPGYIGAGLKVQEVIDGGPLIAATTRLSAGMVIEAIDQTPIPAGADPSPRLNHRAGHRIALSMYDPAHDNRFVAVVKPITLAQEQDLLYRRWLKQRRSEVDKLSAGQIGYVHVKEMNQRSYREVFSEVFGENSGKKAIVVDARFNHGGHLRDDLVTLLSGKQYLHYIPRGQILGWDPIAPVGKWTGKSALVVNEDDYSDGHLFPWVYQHLGIGKLIGTPIPGTGTSAAWEQQQDPQLVVGIPYGTIEDVAGHVMEKTQITPDVQVTNDPESLSHGKDLQLDRAVQVLMAP